MPNPSDIVNIRLEVIPYVNGQRGTSWSVDLPHERLFLWWLAGNESDWAALLNSRNAEIERLRKQLADKRGFFKRRAR